MCRLRISVYLLLILFFPNLISCEDIFETDLSESEVVLLSPKDSLLTSDTLLTFWWEAVQGSSEYNLQIVEPDFKDIIRLKLDTTISENLLKYYLQPGNYQWRVKAINESSRTSYTTNSLFIAKLK